MREFLKRAVLSVVAPVAFVLRVRMALLGLAFPRDRAFELVSESVSRIPGLLGLLVRRQLYRGVLGRCGNSCTFAYGTILTKRSAEFGENVALGLSCVVSATRFGSDIVVGPHVCFLSGAKQHGTARTDIPMCRQEGRYETITIGDDVWIGAGAVILSDIGRGAIVGAGSVVVHPVPHYSIVAGNPARVIGSRRPTTGVTAANADTTTSPTYPRMNSPETSAPKRRRA